MNHLPESQFIDSHLLAQVFNNTTATYKFYWFLSILDIYNTTGKTTMSFRDVICRMIAHAWYPVHYFKLSFGANDLLCQQCHEVQQQYSLNIDIKADKLQNELYTLYNKDRAIHAHILNFGRNVPHWFMSPWFPKCDETTIVQRSQRYENNCPYAIFRTPEKYIKLNPEWYDYLSNNYCILKDFCYWNLVLFLQRRNPNVPDIPNKLCQPLERNSLTKQRNYWNVVMDKIGPISCIYTGRPLTVNDYDLDHFIPWSFVAHDQLWNLLPVDGSINSSKGNHLPSLERYLENFAIQQQRVLKVMTKIAPNNKLLEDYLQLGASLNDLVSMPSESFTRLYAKAMLPLCQIAENMGFTRWNI